MTNAQPFPRNDGWLRSLTDDEGLNENKTHFWSRDPQASLVTHGYVRPEAFAVGSGAELYASTVVPALETAKDEILLVTCYWARSKSLELLSETLIRLSKLAESRGKDHPRLRIRLCFSSQSLTQMLFHTSLASGHVYPPSKWVSLGLPSSESLEGLDLQIKSVFIRPFSVMHPKFIIIDRQRALFPSCNVSWESWLECCISTTGPVVARLVHFWQETWGRNDLPDLPKTASSESCPIPTSTATSLVSVPPHYVINLLPSPHHRSPRFRPFFNYPSQPKTPLNSYLLDIFYTATTSIRLLTPNLTSPPVISALLAALARGVDVTVITNRRMMLLEQLLTAGTITEICIWKLRRQYRKLITSYQSSQSDPEGGQTQNIGKLEVGYYMSDEQHQKCHIKCTIIDEEVVVLGSGNMDRASWYTSQELGIAIEGANVVRQVWESIEQELSMRSMGGMEWLNS